ncbi:hypothetical protein Tco_0517279 [Tanacetum coccineum]
MKATPRKLASADSNKEAPARQAHSASKSQRTPSKNKEPIHLRRSRRLEDRSITKEKARRGRSKSRRKRSRHQETNSDFEYEEGSKDAYENLNSPYKRPKPTPFTQRITHFKYHRRVKLSRNIRVYEGNKDPEDHLGGATRNWFDDLDPKSVDSFEELSQKFLEEFSQKNGVPSVLRISAFMHGHGHPELAKKLNDKISKTVEEMFKRVRAFIRGEVAAGSAEMVCPFQGDKWYVRPASTGGPEKI